MVEAPALTRVIDVIRCLIGDEAYGLEMAWVRRIDRADHLRLQPGPGGAVGVLPDVDGDIPVFSLANQLDRPQAANENGTGLIPHILVLNGDPGPLGLLVDRVSPSQRVPATSFLSLPALVADSSTRYFRGVIKLDKEMMLWLAPERLIPAGTPTWESRGPDDEEGPPVDRLPRRHRDLESRRQAEGQLVIFSTTDSAERKRPISFGLSINQVLEILDLPPLIPVPGAPETIVGLVAWHDRALPVIDLGLRLGLPRLTADARTRLMIARAASSSDPVGFLVRPLVRVRGLPLPHLPCRQAPPVEPSLIRGAMELKDETLVIPDIARVLDIHSA
ncbi:MAG TPA: chemotaxis protein CheW [Isosphaeraceae bacterium]|jgi:chemotaxis signal transduction protein|nr:chemotaxis protein CheW [Isosphaeraceae bacterium]